MVTIAAASELKFRRRSADLALSGSVDAQIILELAIWGALVGLILLGNRGRPRAAGAQHRIAMGRAAWIVATICALGVASAVVTGGALALVRALQFAAMAAVAVVAYQRAENDQMLIEFWQALRRGVLAFAAGASVLTMLWPGRGELGTGRFHWFEVHPISTAGMLGIAIVLAMSAVFGTPDPWLRSRGRWIAFAITVGVLATLLVMTGSRGAMAGTLAGVGTVGVLSTNARRRGIAFLVSLAVGGLLILGFGTEAIIAVAVRGQTAAQLLSLTGRTELFGIAYDLFLERPWLGYGFLSGREVFLERVPWAGEAHNMFVEVAISLGLIGLLLYVALFAWLLRVVAGAVVQRPSVVGTAARDCAGLLAFIIVSGGVTSGAAGLPGMQWLALLVTVVVADCWHRARREALGRLEQRAARAVRPQRDSMTSA